MTAADLTPLLKKYPTSVGCVALSIVCAVVLYLRSGDIAASQADLESKSAEANRMVANVRAAEKLPEQVTEIQGYSKDLDARLMRAGQLAVNLQYFYKLEAETEVKLADVRQNAIVKRPNSTFIAVPFSVTVQGTFAHVSNFLSRLQNGRHFCRVTSANLTRAGGTSSATPSAETADTTLSLTIELLGQQQ